MRRLATTMVLAAVWLAAPAQAQRCDAPAGTGAVDQYCEVVPGSKGDRDPGAAGGPTIDTGTTAVLTNEGKDGEALARVLGGEPAATTPGQKQRQDRPQAGTDGSVALPDAPSSNPFAAVTEAIGGEATLGSPFFFALFGIVLLMLGLAWVGWRRDRSA